MTWREVKKERAKKIGGWYCEECGSEKNIIGHHVIPRRLKNRKAKRLMSWKYCVLRCMSCERKMHILYKNGNRKQNIKQFKRRK